jgi:hypothetical protein
MCDYVWLINPNKTQCVVEICQPRLGAQRR